MLFLFLNRNLYCCNSLTHFVSMIMIVRQSKITYVKRLQIKRKKKEHPQIHYIPLWLDPKS